MWLLVLHSGVCVCVCVCEWVCCGKGEGAMKRREHRSMFKPSRNIEKFDTLPCHMRHSTLPEQASEYGHCEHTENVVACTSQCSWKQHHTLKPQH